MTVMRFVADVAGRRNRHGPDNLAVLRGFLVEVDDGKEIRGYVSLVLRPDIKNLVGTVATVVGQHETGSGHR